MANWSKNKTLPANINGGNEYAVDDNVSLEDLNAITNNSFYAMDRVDNLSNPNLLINGDFRVNQRSFSTSDFVRGQIKYSYDRWRYYHWGNDCQIEKNADGSIYIYNNTTETSSGEGILYFAQQVEDFSNKVFNNETYTMSCKYKLEYPDSMYKGDAYFYGEFNGASTTGTITGKLEPTNTPLIAIRTFTVSGTATRGLATFNLRRGAKLTLYWVKLEVGEVATPFSPRPYAEELAMCQRYYWRCNFNDQMPISIGLGRNTTTLGMILTVPKLRTNPTSVIDGKFKISNSPSTTNLTFSLNQYNDGFARYYCTTTGLTEGSAYIISGNSAGYLSLDAEIY